MNKLYCFVCFIFLGVQIGHGQSVLKEQIKTPFLFSENNKVYLLTKDSIFNLSDNPWSSRPHSLDLTAYYFLGNQSNSFLIHNYYIVQLNDGSAARTGWLYITY